VYRQWNAVAFRINKSVIEYAGHVRALSSELRARRRDRVSVCVWCVRWAFSYFWQVIQQRNPSRSNAAFIAVLVCVTCLSLTAGTHSRPFPLSSIFVVDCSRRRPRVVNDDKSLVVTFRPELTLAQPMEHSGAQISTPSHQERPSIKGN